MSDTYKGRVCEKGVGLVVEKGEQSEVGYTFH